MAFVCPQCQQDSLTITHVLELPPDGRSDEITLQLIACTECRFVGTAVYEESRRGASESWHHDGYDVDRADYDELQRLIKQCPNPRNSRCRCLAHRQLNQVNEYGVWQRPLQSQKQRTFFMQRKRR